MEINLKGNYVLESDSSQIILKKKRTTSGGRVVKDPVGYFSTLHQALEAYVKKQLFDSEAVTIGELLGELRGLESYIKGILKEH